MSSPPIDSTGSAITTPRRRYRGGESCATVRPRFVIVAAGEGRVKRYRKAAGIGADGDRRGGGSYQPPPSLWDRDLWSEALFSDDEPQLASSES
jgi:hypothetical protein